MPLMCEIDLPFLSQYFHLPINDVAKEIGVCATVLKKICRKNGIPRWPHRKIKSIDKMISNLENTTPKNMEVDVRIKEEIENLKRKKAYLIKNPNILGLKSKTIKESVLEGQGQIDLSGIEPSSSPTPNSQAFKNLGAINNPYIHHQQQSMMDEQQICNINNNSSSDSIGSSVPTSPNYHSYPAATPTSQQPPQNFNYFQTLTNVASQQQHHHHHHPYSHPHSQPTPQYNTELLRTQFYQQQQQVQQPRYVSSSPTKIAPVHHNPPSPSPSTWSIHHDSPFQTLKQVATDEQVHQSHHHQQKGVSPVSLPPSSSESSNGYLIQLPKLQIPNSSSVGDDLVSLAANGSHLQTLEPTSLIETSVPSSQQNSPSSQHYALPSWFKKEHDIVLQNFSQQQLRRSPSSSSQQRPSNNNIMKVNQLIVDEDNVPTVNIQHITSPSSLSIDC